MGVTGTVGPVNVGQFVLGHELGIDITRHDFSRALALSAPSTSMDHVKA